MKTNSTLFLVFVSVLTLTMAGVDVHALDILDNKVHISGYVENQSAIRLQDGINEAGTLSRMRTILQMEGGVDLTPNVSFNTIITGFLDGAWDLQNQLIQAPKDQHSVPAGRNMRRDVDAREYYLKGKWGNLSYKIGRQQIAWGETDLFRMADIINPIDYSWRANTEPYENIRIPQRMIDLTYTFPGRNEFKIELVLDPEDFKTTRLAAPGANWDPLLYGFNYNFKNTANLPIAQAFWREMQRDLDKLGQYSLNNFQGGTRLRGKFGDFDASLFYYNSRVQDAVSTVDFTSAPLPLRFHWPRIQNLGGTVNFPEHLFDSVIRFECAYTFNQPFTLNNRTISGLPDTIFATKDEFSFMIGFDRHLWLKFLNPSKAFTISGQSFNRFIAGKDTSDGGRLQTGFGLKGYSKSENIETFLISGEYYEGKIIPTVAVGYSPTAKGGVILPDILYQPTTHISIDLGGMIWGSKYTTSANFGAFRRNDEIYLHLRYGF